MSTFGVVCLDVVSIVQSGLDDIKRLNGGNVCFFIQIHLKLSPCGLRVWYHPSAAIITD